MGETYDLEERLLEYAARIIRLVEKLPDTRAGNHQPVVAFGHLSAAQPCGGAGG